jgi:hypothetical protein
MEITSAMDIGSGKGYPSSALSNFAPQGFIFDGVEVASREGILQALKFDKPHIQVEVCKLVGIGAKKRGSDRNVAWKSRQTLWWNGVTYGRKSVEYQRLLDRIFIEITKQNEKFRSALIASGDAVFTHTIGRNSESDTVLTQREFCRRLTALRKLLKTGADLEKITEL